MNSNTNPFSNGQTLAQMSDDARKTMGSAFDAMSTWRHDMTAMSEKNSAAVFGKMSEAAKSMGWPTEFVDMTQQQVMNATKMQTQVMDQVMDTWQKQATSPTPTFQMPAMPTFPGMPSFGGTGFGGAGGSSMFPGMPDMGSMPMMPVQFWMQAAEMWQKSWQQALGQMMDAQANMMGKAGSTSSKSKPG